MSLEPNRLCGNCKRSRACCINSPPCDSCFFHRDDNGMRTKPSFKPKKKNYNKGA